METSGPPCSRLWLHLMWLVLAAAPLAQPVVTGVSGGAAGLPEDVAVGPGSVAGSLQEEWIVVTGRGFGPDAVARLRAPGVNSEIASDRRLRRQPPDTLEVRATFGTEADQWTVEVTSGGETSAPFPFLVVPPRPVIQGVEVLDGGIRRSEYRVRLTGPAYAATSEILVDGRRVPTTSVKSSPYPQALTIGVEAMVSASAFRNGAAEVRVRTPGAAGGEVSEPATALLPPIPWTARPEIWMAILLGLVTLGVVGYRGGVRRAQERAVRVRLETEVAERTAEIESARSTLELQSAALAERSEALDAALATQEAQAKALQKAADQRARVFAGVTHDLRTPLSVVLASLGAVLDRGPSDDDHTDLEAARRATGHLVRLSESLSEAARHESGQVELSVGLLDVAEVAADVVADQAVLFERLGLTVTVEADGPAWAQADAWALRRVLTNLLDNAAKFAPQGGVVTVTVERRDRTVRLAVQDTGPGFSAEMVDRAFEAYEQGKASSSRQGVGLGLSVVRDLLGRQGGTARAEPGPGGTVVVTLPLVDLSTGGGDLVVPEEVGAQTPRVVIAEDDPELRAMLVRILSGAFVVEAVADGQAALDAVRGAPPAVVVSDVMMPGLDGMGLVRALRAEPWSRDVPVLLVTALDAPEHMVAAFEAGADDYVTKPFDRAVLLARVKRLVGGRSEVGVAGLPVGPDGDPLSPDDARLVETVRAAVEAHLGELDFDVVALGKAVGLGKAQLGRRLREALDESPAKVIERIRLGHAAGLLRGSGQLVKEVAGEVGYRDVRTFSRAFQRRFGMSPSQWGDDSA